MEQIEKTVRNFWFNNWKWFVTIIFFAGVNFATLQYSIENKLDKDTAQEIINTTINDHVIPLISDNSKAINANTQTISEMKENNIANISITKEIKYNLKALMKANGLEYIEDTDK